MKPVDALCRNYLWSGQLDKRAMDLVSWDTICTPKTEGGLSIKQLSVWNKAACGNMLRKILAKPSCLWTRWIKDAYLRGKCLWRAHARQDDSWCWKKLLKFQTEFFSHIGDGRQISLIYDSWLPNGAIASRINDDTANWGSDLVVQKWIGSNGEWVIPRSFRRRFLVLTGEIVGMSLNTQEDRYILRLNAFGAYSIASYYENIRRRNPKVSWFRLVWNGKVPMKFRFIAWLLMHQRLKTRALLARRGLDIDTSCMFCTCPTKNCSHLFFACNYTKEVWKTVLGEFGISRDPTSWEMELRWLKQAYKGRSTKAKIIRSCTVYMLWWERNKRVFHLGSNVNQVVAASIVSLVRLTL